MCIFAGTIVVVLIITIIYALRDITNYKKKT
jgi:hypothetical protein